MVEFSALPTAKQASVLNAAFSCFGKAGYKKASVAEIAAAAGISKASVFQYFGSKKELYFFLFQYACDKILGEPFAGTDDFFECLKIGSDIKMRVVSRHPGMFDFLSSLVVETDEAILSEIKPLVTAQVDTGLADLLARVNWNKLKPGVDRGRLMNTVRWVNEGYLRESVGKKDYDTMRRELFGYFDLIRNACYKEEYLV